MIIHKYITHVLDKNADAPILNDKENKISMNIDKFIQKSIKKAKKDDYLRKAKFKKHNDNHIKKLCDEMIHDDTTFVENSKEIASYLFEVMSASSEIQSCDLVICLFTVKDETSVAIIKLDYKSAYNSLIDFKDDKFNVQIIENEKCIQETFKPRQCAIVGVNSINDMYDLEVLDIDAEKENTQSVFTKDFLKCEMIVDDKINTFRFIELTKVYINNFYYDDLLSMHNALNILAYVMLSTSSVDLEEFADKMFSTADLEI